MLLRLAYLGVTNALAMLRLFPVGDRGKDVEILALRHQIMVLQRQLGNEKVRFDPADRAFLAALLHRLPRDVLRRVRLLVRPETVIRWHRSTNARRHAAASRPHRAGREGCQVAVPQSRAWWVSRGGRVCAPGAHRSTR